MASPALFLTANSCRCFLPCCTYVCALSALILALARVRSVYVPRSYLLSEFVSGANPMIPPALPLLMVGRSSESCSPSLGDTIASAAAAEPLNIFPDEIVCAMCTSIASKRARHRARAGHLNAPKNQ